VPGLRSSTDYINTIPPEREPWFPGDEYVERADPRLHPVERRGDGVPGETARGLGVGGHIATLRLGGPSLYEVGFKPLLPWQGPR